MRQHRFLIAGAIALAVALMAAVAAWAQEPRPRVENLACESRDSGAVYWCGFEVWIGDAPLEVDDDGEPVVYTMFAGHADKVAEAKAEGGESGGNALRVAVMRDVFAKARAEIARVLAEAPEVEAGLPATISNDSLEVDEQFEQKRAMVRRLRTEFVAARDRVDDEGEPAPDCDAMRAILDEATELLGAEDSRVVAGERAYTNASCGGGL